MVGNKKLTKNYNYNVYDMSKPVTKILKKIIDVKNYNTDGEFLIVVKNVDQCEIILNNKTTEHIVIKALTKVILKDLNKKIDELYDEIIMDKGSSVELSLVEGFYYIIASDGLKFE
jgi:hypothetical protein